MSQKWKIGLIYVVTAIVSVAILAVSMWLRRGFEQREQPAVNTGAAVVDTLFPISEDLEGWNQSGQKVKLSDLKGKVWVVAEFFAVCPHCAVRNGAELTDLIKKYGSNPDFQLVCISIDPNRDDVERIKDYAAALGADAKNWWFLTTLDEQKAHRYMDQVMKFFSVRERTDPVDIESNGRFAHDLGMALINKNFEMVGKWPLVDAKNSDPQLYAKLKAEMQARIDTELKK